MFSNRNEDSRPRSPYRHRDNIEVVESHEAYANGRDSSIFEKAEDDESSFEVARLPPERYEDQADSDNGSVDEWTPLKANEKTDTRLQAQAVVGNVPESGQHKFSNFLMSLKSPPEWKAKKQLFNGGVSNDSSIRTPLRQIQPNHNNSSGGSTGTPKNFVPSRYLVADEESPNGSYPAILESHSAFTHRSPDNQSCDSNQPHLSGECLYADPRPQSIMSCRSSTSLSLLYGEVITLENSKLNSKGEGQSRNSNTSPLAQPYNDIEGARTLEGMEIGMQPTGRQSSSSEKSLLAYNRRPGQTSKITEYISSIQKPAVELGRNTQKQIEKITSFTSSASQNIFHHYRPPPSPRTQELEDLQFLQRSHKEKVGRMVDNIDDEQHFDFVLVLTPQETYRYWAELLDFRVEQGVDTELSMDTILEMTSTHSTDNSSDSDDTQDKLTKDLVTPLTGIHRRRGPRDVTPPTSLHAPNTAPHRFEYVSNNSGAMFCSPSIRSGIGTGSRKGRLSLFEKAVGFQSPSFRKAMEGSTSGEDFRTPTREARPSVSSVRRRWGNHAVTNQGKSTPHMLSPPVRSLTRGNAASRRRIDSKAGKHKRPENLSEKAIVKKNQRGEDIPNPVIPRGIAARTNGLLQFLSALKRGIVLRRHRPNKSAVFCKIFSTDGGDTIQYHMVDPEEAMVAFKEQRVRYNKNLTHSSKPNVVRTMSREWSILDDPGDASPVHKFKLPDFIAAQRYRKKLMQEHGLTKRIIDLATKAANSGIVRTTDLVAVHPAIHLDPRNPGSRNQQHGTATLRRSKSDYSMRHTFSLISMVGQRLTGKANKVDANENKWYSGEGSELQFKVLDLEAATQGEYWLIFRGFLLLHRDAAVGRFAAERRAGIGGGNRRDRDPGDGEEDELENRLHQDEFNEPKTVGFLERMIVKARKLDDSYMKGFVLPGAVPPPSDYFLGFRSPGTQIWSRLRLAGLETQRVYAVDTRRVMIKVRCPEDRLADVAEVLRVKMKTTDGGFAAFREDNVDIFEPRCDALECPSIYHQRPASLLLSKDRQMIIDFIIGSRIRDSGAELAQTTDVGKMIQARVPLHMHKKLDALCKVWVWFWRRENWIGRDGRSLTCGPTSVGRANGAPTVVGGDESENDKNVPNCLRRFFVGAFHQPLDSVEEYFGEQVTFYFAWLQHCSNHLVFLTVCGLIVTVCQLSSMEFDHPIRPFFSVIVMLWTFVVLVNWRKRANFLAYRWGSMDYKVQETTRPEFHGEYETDEITKEWVVRYPAWKRWLKYTISFPVSILFTGVAVLLILLVHANRDLQMASYVQKKTDPTNAEEFQFEFSLNNIGRRAPIVEIPLTRELLLDPTFWIVMGALPSMLGLCIPIMNLILMKISVMLNNFENYKTESEYRTHLIIKVFSFRFVSQFGTVYYYAVISMGSRQAIENGLLRMATSLLIYTTVAHWWHLFLQVHLFMWVRKIRCYLYRKNLKKALRDVELEEEALSGTSDVETKIIKLQSKRMLLEQAQDDIWFEIMNPPHDSFPEYITAVVQFTFVACFSVVLPITPLFCLFNYLLSIRYDAYKLCRGRRRPFARKTGGIGIWEHLLHIVAVIAVLTNCWLMGFTNQDFTWLAEKVGGLGIFAIVVGWEHVMLLIKYVMQTTISPLPRSVRDDLKREEHRIGRERHSYMRRKKRRRSILSQIHGSESHMSQSHMSQSHMSLTQADYCENSVFREKGVDAGSALSESVMKTPTHRRTYPSAVDDPNALFSV